MVFEIKNVVIFKSIAIYIDGCNLNWWAQEWPKSLKIPGLIVNNGRQKPPQNRGGFLLYFRFFFLSIFVFFPVVSPCFLLFLDILEPQNRPLNEVTGA